MSRLYQLGLWIRKGWDGICEQPHRNQLSLNALNSLTNLTHQLGALIYFTSSFRQQLIGSVWKWAEPIKPYSAGDWMIIQSITIMTGQSDNTDRGSYCCSVNHKIWATFRNRLSAKHFSSGIKIPFLLKSSFSFVVCFSFSKKCDLDLLNMQLSC